MRKTLMFLILLVCPCALIPAAASATATGDQTVPDLTGSVGPTLDRVGSKPHSMALSIDLGFRSLVADQLPATLAKAELKFTRGALVNGKLFQQCNARLLEQRKKCPKASFLGRARIDAAVGRSVADQLAVPLVADLYNAKGGRGIVFHFQATTPISINVVEVASLVPIRERFYGYKLTLKVPESLQMPLVGIPSSVIGFHVTVKKSRRVHGRTRGWIETSLCPPGAEVPLQGRFTYRDGVVATSTSSIVCGGQKPS